MVALGRKYDTGIFLSPTKETWFLYLYTCYLDEDYVPRYARNFVLYEGGRLFYNIIRLSYICDQWLERGYWPFRDNCVTDILGGQM